MEAREELHVKMVAAAVAVPTADDAADASKMHAALESAQTLANSLAETSQKDKATVATLELDRAALQSQLDAVQLVVQQLTKDLELQSCAAAVAAADAAAVEVQSKVALAAMENQLDAFEDQMKGLIRIRDDLESELKDCRSKQADQALDLEEATMAVKAIHAGICKQGPAAAQGGIGVALASEMVRVKGNPVKMYKVAQLATSGPAAASGQVKAGDYILEVDGRKLGGMHSKDVQNLIRGPSGSTISLRAQRPGAGGGPYEVSLIRGGGEADQSLASMSESASSLGGSVVGAAGSVVRCISILCVFVRVFVCFCVCVCMCVCFVACIWCACVVRGGSWLCSQVCI